MDWVMDLAMDWEEVMDLVRGSGLVMLEEMELESVMEMGSAKLLDSVRAKGWVMVTDWETQMDSEMGLKEA